MPEVQPSTFFKDHPILADLWKGTAVPIAPEMGAGQAVSKLATRIPGSAVEEAGSTLGKVGGKLTRWAVRKLPFGHTAEQLYDLVPKEGKPSAGSGEPFRPNPNVARKLGSTLSKPTERPISSARPVRSGINRAIEDRPLAKPAAKEEAGSDLLDQISKGQAGKKFEHLTPKQQETVKAIAKDVQSRGERTAGAGESAMPKPPGKVETIPFSKPSGPAPAGVATSVDKAKALIQGGWDASDKTAKALKAEGWTEPEIRQVFKDMGNLLGKAKNITRR